MTCAKICMDEVLAMKSMTLCWGKVTYFDDLLTEASLMLLTMHSKGKENFVLSCCY